MHARKRLGQTGVLLTQYKCQTSKFSWINNQTYGEEDISITMMVFFLVDDKRNYCFLLLSQQTVCILEQIEERTQSMLNLICNHVIFFNSNGALWTFCFIVFLQLLLNKTYIQNTIHHFGVMIPIVLLWFCNFVLWTDML